MSESVLDVLMYLFETSSEEADPRDPRRQRAKNVRRAENGTDA